ncbi:response regulator transcription factor [Saccharopolyspora taberi]|uniref:Response regulator transcription factor n=1 Tax=Saccharopolyspora taberi TaxID=60895 RepID=A0ABN3VGK1_9PSEU
MNASSRQKILIAEDERRIAALLEDGLRAGGYATTVVADGRDAYVQARSGEHDLLVLDIALPSVDGFTVLRRLREEDRRTPVIILTARGGVKDTVAGLEGGADDYMSKPFRFEELLARIRLRLRDDNDAAAHLLRHGGLALDLRLRQMHVDDRIVDLTAREFTLAEVLLRNRGRVLTREYLVSAVWGADHDPGSNVVDVYVRYLRRKLGADRITTVRGKGYRLD